MALKLTGIALEHGSCDRCGRELGKVFRLSDGGTYGRRCAAVLTGYQPNDIERENRIAARVAEISRRRAIVSAAMPGLTGSDEAMSYLITTEVWWGGRGWSDYASWQEYATEMIQRDILSLGAPA